MAAPDQTQPIGAGRTLTLSTHWSVSGPEDRRSLYAPVSVKSSSRRPLDWRQHLRPLLAFQGLVNLAYQGFVVADGGQAEPDVLAGGRHPAQEPVWWNGTLMRVPPGAPTAAKLAEVPDFVLEHLGGMPGLRRWLQLASAHPRAVGPLVNATRFGTGGAETRLLEMAAAIEYWVAHQRRDRKWTRAGRNFAEALARHVGHHFTDWVGDVEFWADDYWTTYTGLKHNPNFARDPYEIHMLATACSLLLQSALLNRAASCKSPSAAVFSSHRNTNLGHRIRELRSR